MLAPVDAVAVAANGSTPLRPYVPHVLVEWLADGGPSWRTIEGTLAFVDISGFTRLTERLARRGRVGAEEMNDVLDACFVRLLAAADEEGADLLKWGGDAVLLLFRGPHHAERACRAAWGMRAALQRMGAVRTSAGRAVLRMSVGVHSGRFHCFLTNGRHRELILSGPAASRTAEAEAVANAGQIAVTDATARQLPRHVLGPPWAGGFLLRGLPEPVAVVDPARHDAVDLSRALSEPVRRHLVDAGTATGEHRRISVAFLQFSGVDGLLRRSRPGLVARRLETLLGVVQDVAHDEGVTFLESDIAVDGGKLMLLAGAPTSEGDDEERMLRTVRAALDADCGLRLRAGVHAGAVFAGGFGPPGRRTFSVKGDAVNLAARLAGRARQGELLATATVLGSSRSAFVAEQLPPFIVKGKARPIEAFSIGRQLQPVPRPVGHPPLVGRDDELARLQIALDEARRGTGRVVQLVGEPGIGKSRLVADLVARADGFRTLTVTCERYAAATPYAGVRQLVLQALGVEPGPDEAARLERALREVIATEAPDVLPSLPLIAGALGVDVTDTDATLAFEQRFRKRRLEEALCALVLAAAPGPALLVLEEAHWLDQASVDAITGLAAATRGRPWLIVIARRDRPGGILAPAEPEPVDIRLDALSADAASTLVLIATEGAPLSPHRTEEVVRRAGGNPLFLLELVASAGSGSIDGMPESIEAVLTSHVDRLAIRDRLVLRYASVLGTAIDDAILAELLRDDAPVPGEDVWQRLAAFVELGRDGVRRFRQALVRDAAYDGLPFRTRRELHARAATAIAARAGSRVDDAAELLSLHAFHAHRFEDAWRLARLAGDRAAAAYANVDAARLYERALAAARELPDVPSPELAAVHESIGDVRALLGEFAPAGMAYARARIVLRHDPVAQARLLLKHARIPERLGRYSEALRWTTRGLRAVEGREDREAAQQRAQLKVWRAAVLQAQGRHADAVRWCEQAIVEAEASADRDALAHAYFLLDWAYFDLGRPERATFSRVALGIYEELGDLGRQAVVLNNLGAWAYYRGDWDEAVELYERGRVTRERTGDAVNAAFGTCNIGEILSDQGRLDEAEPRFREAKRVWQAAGDRPGVAFVTSALGRVATRAGRVEEALELLEEARAAFAHVGARVDVDRHGGAHGRVPCPARAAGAGARARRREPAARACPGGAARAAAAARARPRLGAGRARRARRGAGGLRGERRGCAAPPGGVRVGRQPRRDGPDARAARPRRGRGLPRGGRTNPQPARGRVPAGAARDGLRQAGTRRPAGHASRLAEADPRIDRERDQGLDDEVADTGPVPMVDARQHQAAAGATVGDERRAGAEVDVGRMAGDPAAAGDGLRVGEDDAHERPWVVRAGRQHRHDRSDTGTAPAEAGRRRRRIDADQQRAVLAAGRDRDVGERRVRGRGRVARGARAARRAGAVRQDDRHVEVAAGRARDAGRRCEERVVGARRRDREIGEGRDAGDCGDGRRAAQHCVGGRRPQCERDGAGRGRDIAEGVEDRDPHGRRDRSADDRRRRLGREAEARGRPGRDLDPGLAGRERAVSRRHALRPRRAEGDRERVRARVGRGVRVRRRQRGGRVGRAHDDRAAIPVGDVAVGVQRAHRDRGGGTGDRRRRARDAQRGGRTGGHGQRGGSREAAVRRRHGVRPEHRRDAARARCTCRRARSSACSRR